MTAGGTRRKPDQAAFAWLDEQWCRDNYADECFRPDDPKRIRLSDIPLMACAAAAHERDPKVKQSKFDWVLHTGGHNRAEHIAAVRKVLASEKDQKVRELMRAALRHLTRPLTTGPPPSLDVATVPVVSRSRSRAPRSGGSRATRAGPDGDPSSDLTLATSPAAAGPIGLPGKRAA
jgi:hypothetical protein